MDTTVRGFTLVHRPNGQKPIWMVDCRTNEERQEGLWRITQLRQTLSAAAPAVSTTELEHETLRRYAEAREVLNAMEPGMRRDLLLAASSSNGLALWLLQGEWQHAALVLREMASVSSGNEGGIFTELAVYVELNMTHALDARELVAA
jgi:hypothetical protein